MLLIKVGLKNFMKHESLSVSLEAGMNVIRGSNEAGKSSLLTGIAYNWFGSMALPQPVDDTVTWGAKKTAMKTMTQFSIGPNTYVCYRSASGAELYRGDKDEINAKPLVTGHKEVSAVVATLFELPSVATATKLQIASQNDIRGVISLGATAAAAFIEELINMSDIDEMIKDVSGQITYSSDAKKQAVASADAAEEQLKELGKLKSTKKLENVVKKLNDNQTHLNSEKSEAYEAVTQAHIAEQTCISQLNTTTALRNGLVDKIAKAAGKLRLPVDVISDDDIAAEAELLAQTQIYNFYINEFLPHQKTRMEAEWEGTFESFELYMKGLEDQRENLNESITETKVDMAKVEASIITETTCPTCGQEICDAHEVEIQNTVLEGTLADLEITLTDTVDKLANCNSLLTEANRLLTFHKNQLLWVSKRPMVTEVNTNVVPSVIDMVAGEPVKPERSVTQSAFNTLCLKRDQQKAAMDAYTENKNLHDRLLEEEAEYGIKVDELNAEKEKLQAALLEAKEDFRVKSAEFDEASAEFRTKEQELSMIKLGNEALKKSKADLEATKETWSKKAEEIQRNSNLISALRSARLDISSLLWQKLLGVTENYFSLFRGRPSTLSMSKKGILVDGHLSAPSGSTLDVLGLALRLAMSKLFANNGLCILDEPSAGCDDARTAAMTGGLLAAGFDQVLMVTHKDVDDQAGNLIIL